MGEVLCTKDQQWAFPAHTHLEHAGIWASPFPRAKPTTVIKKKKKKKNHLQGTRKSHDYSFILGTYCKDIDAGRNK